MFRQKKTFYLRVTALLIVVLFFQAGCDGSSESPRGSGDKKNESYVGFDIDEVEVLFDFYSIPPQWSRKVPLMTEFKVTEFERIENRMVASGYGELNISRAKNFYHNALQSEGSKSFTWNFNPEKQSVTEGFRLELNFIDAEANTLKINLTEIDDALILFELDFLEYMPESF